MAPVKATHRLCQQLQANCGSNSVWEADSGRSVVRKNSGSFSSAEAAAARAIATWQSLSPVQRRHSAALSLHTDRRTGRRTDSHLVSVHTHIHASISTTHIHKDIHTYIRIYKNAYIHTYMHTYICACMHACIYIYVHQ